MDADDGVLSLVSGRLGILDILLFIRNLWTWILLIKNSLKLTLSSAS